jgi:hypothetical protein
MLRCLDFHCFVGHGFASYSSVTAMKNTFQFRSVAEVHGIMIPAALRRNAPECRRFAFDRAGDFSRRLNAPLLSVICN